MKASELKIQTPDQLQDQLHELKKERFNLRFQQATGQVEKTSRFKEIRRDIARIKTIMKQNLSKEN